MLYMNTHLATELLISARRINEDRKPDLYEFVLNESLHVIECVHIESLPDAIIYPINDYQSTLSDVLFELNHVRVNPRMDNSYIIGKLTSALNDIGVAVYNTPKSDSLATCYRPLGEITENVRFYFNELGRCTFLCPNAKLKVVPKGMSRKFG